MAALHVGPAFNPEEAAHAAAEFVANLDNLPGEVAFLLEEIRDKDARINGLLERINVRHSSLTKNARNTILKAASAAASSSSDSPAPSSTQPYPLPLPAGSTLPIAHLSQKEQQAVTKILTEFDKVHALQDEKIHLAERMERIVLRAKERGRAEWLRVGGKDVGELDRDDGGSQRGSKAGTPVGEGMVGGLAAGLGMERPQKKRKPNLSLGASMPPPPTPVRHPPLGTSNSFLVSAHNTPLSSSHGSTSGRKQRGNRDADAHSVAASDADAEGEMEDYVNYSGAGAGGSASMSAYGLTGPMSSSHGSSSGRPPRGGHTITHPPVEHDVDMDADGEADGDGESDDRPYCICQQKSYGEMIGCDNDECPYEWFHVKCVNITGELPETWYCNDCIKLLGLVNSAGLKKKARKSRG